MNLKDLLEIDYTGIDITNKCILNDGSECLYDLAIIDGAIHNFEQQIKDGNYVHIGDGKKVAKYDECFRDDSAYHFLVCKTAEHRHFLQKIDEFSDYLRELQYKYAKMNFEDNI